MGDYMNICVLAFLLSRLVITIMLGSDGGGHFIQTTNIIIQHIIYFKFLAMAGKLYHKREYIIISEYVIIK